MGDRKLEMSLEHAAGSLAEAYRIGAEEAQHVIAVRIEQAFERAARKSSKTTKEVPMRAVSNADTSTTGNG